MTRRISVCAFLVPVLLLPLNGFPHLRNAAAQNAPAAEMRRPVPPEVVVREAGQTVVRAVRITEPLRIDGRLDEPAYSEVASIGDFIQSVPKEGAPRVRTDRRVGPFRRQLHVRLVPVLGLGAARAVDGQRDAPRHDRSCGRTTCSACCSTPFTIAGTGSTSTPIRLARSPIRRSPMRATRTWTGIRCGRCGPDVSRAAGQRSWRIPFKALRYQSGSDQTWGIQLRRAHPPQERVRPPDAPSRPSTGGSRASSVSRWARRSSVSTCRPASKNLELKPYAISKLETDVLRVPRRQQQLGPGAGGDVKYGVTANLTADLTINTDFAQVEVDEQQVNLTRFNLQFPEKREFFLEGRGIFDFGRGSGQGANNNSGVTPQLFYTRRIGLNRNRVVPIDVRRATDRQGRPVQPWGPEHPDRRRASRLVAVNQFHRAPREARCLPQEQHRRDVHQPLREHRRPGLEPGIRRGRRILVLSRT